MQKLRSHWQNPWTLAGAVLAVLSVLFFVSFQIIELLAPTGNPYTGLWSFLILPAVLVVGLLFIPLGWLLERRRRRRLFPEIKEWPRYPHLDLNDPRHRKALAVFGVGTLVVIPLIGVSSYEGYHYTDSTQFCGQVCHSVMHPEYTSYRNSPHARVTCAACHIGPGAGWFVKSKLGGVRQVFAVTFETYSRPIPTPVKDLRPARETCEECHWPAKFFGSQLRTRVHFAPDEQNTRREIRVLVKTGGGDSSNGPASGIHWHMALSHKIEYIATDNARQVIPWVRAADPAGRVTVYRSDGKSSKELPPQGELRKIDCMDCHNRPTHIIQAPDRAVNISLETGRLDRTLPYLKKVAVEALIQPYSKEEEADRKIEAAIWGFYRNTDASSAELRKGSLNQAVEETRAIYRRNFFPRMKVDWRAYPDNIGHMFFDGCFRCHDNKHVSDDKRPIRKDCSVCHEFQQPVSMEGVQNTFQVGTIEHPVKLEGIHAELKCSACHTGGSAPVAACAGCHTRQDLFVQGKSPSLPGSEAAPSVMAGVDCDSCHDLSKPQTSANLAAQCEQCHEKGYGDMIQVWKEEAESGRAKARAALEGVSSAPSAGAPPKDQGTRLKTLLHQLHGALEEIDRAGAIHNPGFADAVYSQIVKLAAEIPSNSAKK